MSQPAEAVAFFQSRWDYCEEERQKAMHNGNQVVELFYQLLMIEYDAQIQHYKAQIPE